MRLKENKSLEEYDNPYWNLPTATSSRAAQGLEELLDLLTQALNEAVVVTEDGRRRRISKRELGLKRLAKSAMAEAQATKMLLGLMLERERLTAAVAPAERSSFAAADEQVVASLFKRLRSEE